VLVLVLVLVLVVTVSFLKTMNGSLEDDEDKADKDKDMEDTTSSSLGSSLALKFPMATASECHRFQKAYGDQASDHLQAYLEWRTMYHHDSQQCHQVDLNRTAWERAWDRTWDQVEKCQADTTGQVVLFPQTMTTTTTTNENESPPSEKDLSSFQRTPVPQYVFAHKNNYNTATTAASAQAPTSIILQVFPARIDLKVASAEIHALATAIYLDETFSLDTTAMDQEEVIIAANVWVDVRGAPPWPNGKPMKLLPLIRTMASRLVALQPERLQHLIVFPLPAWAVAIYNMIRVFLPVVITSRTILVSGSDKHDIPPPVDKMVIHIAGEEQHAKEIVQQMEATRQQAVVEAEAEQSAKPKEPKVSNGGLASWFS
jgi:thiamine phosphate synthase YjbQ (UPF0047 family)